MLSVAQTALQGHDPPHRQQEIVSHPLPHPHTTTTTNMPLSPALPALLALSLDAYNAMHKETPATRRDCPKRGGGGVRSRTSESQGQAQEAAELLQVLQEDRRQMPARSRLEKTQQAQRLRGPAVAQCRRWRPAGDYVHHPVLEKPTTTATTTSEYCAV